MRNTMVVVVHQYIIMGLDSGIVQSSVRDIASRTMPCPRKGGVNSAEVRR